MSDQVFLCSPVRWRPENPEALKEALRSWPLTPWLAIDGRRAQFQGIRIDSERSEWVELGASEDSREIGGPRTTGETQENIAFLRSKCFRAWSKSKASWCFMVDSDVVLAPNALEVALSTLQGLMERHGGPCTLSLQIDNRVTEDHPPATNAMDDNHVPIPWADDGRVTEVARSGAVTLYPRDALLYRFHWAPGYNEEHQHMFDQMRAKGWRHFLLQDPQLTDHRMRRMRSGFDLLRENRDARQRRESDNGSD